MLQVPWLAWRWKDHCCRYENTSSIYLRIYPHAIWWYGCKFWWTEKPIHVSPLLIWRTWRSISLNAYKIILHTLMFASKEHEVKSSQAWNRERRKEISHINKLLITNILRPFFYTYFIKLINLDYIEYILRIFI